MKTAFLKDSGFDNLEIRTFGLAEDNSEYRWNILEMLSLSWEVYPLII